MPEFQREYVDELRDPCFARPGRRHSQMLEPGARVVRCLGPPAVRGNPSVDRAAASENGSNAWCSTPRALGGTPSCSGSASIEFVQTTLGHIPRDAASGRSRRWRPGFPEARSLAQRSPHGQGP
jgi:hypothetical protein